MSNIIGVRFEGGLGNLPQTVGKANDAIDGFGQSIATTGGAMRKWGGQIGKSFKGIGGAAMAIMPFLDATTQSFVMFALTGINSIKKLAMSMKLLGAGMQILLVGGLLAAAAAVGHFAGRLIAGSAATERALKQIYRLTTAMRQLRKDTQEVSEGWDKYEDSMKKATIEYRIFGDEQKMQNAIADAAHAQLIAIRTDIDKLAASYGANIEKLSQYRRATALAQAEIDKLSAVTKGYLPMPPQLSQALAQAEQNEKNLGATQDQNVRIIENLWAEYYRLLQVYNDARNAVSRLTEAEKERGNQKTFELSFDMGAEFEEAIAWEKKFQDQTASLQGSLMDFVVSLRPTIEGIGLQFANLWTQFSQGFGDAVARALVYGESFAEGMKELGKQLLSTLISFLVQTVINALLYGVLETLIMGGLAAGRIALQASIAAAAAYASAIETMGIFGMAAGPGFAAAAAAGVVAASTKGFAIGRAGAAALGPLAVSGVGSYAEGGLFSAPTLALIGEAGTEAVVPLDRIKEMMGDRGVTEVNIELNGRTIAQAVVPWIPTIVHSKGVKGI